MGRKLEFDKDEALKMAMESFWKNGYTATSMRDLAAKLGIHLGSVYNALGDKEKLFESSLRLNIESCILPKLQKINETENALEAITGYLDRIVEECSNPDKYPGCFVVNSLLNITDISATVSKTLQEYMTQLENTLIDCIKRGQQGGVLSPNLEATESAHFIIATMFSIRTMSKLGLPAAYLHNAKICALRALKK